MPRGPGGRTLPYHNRGKVPRRRVKMNRGGAVRRPPRRPAPRRPMRRR